TTPLRALAHVQGEARGAGQGVVPQVHRRRARMAGPSGEVNGVPLDAEGAQHRAYGDAEPFEHGTLLDVHFQVRLDVGEAVAGFKGPVEINTARGQRVRQGDALAILEPPYGVGVER